MTTGFSSHLRVWRGPELVSSVPLDFRVLCLYLYSYIGASVPFKIVRLLSTAGSRHALKSNLTTSENLAFGNLQWFGFSPCCSDIEVYIRVSQYTVTSLLGVVTGATAHTADHTPQLGAVRNETGWSALVAECLQRRPHNVTASSRFDWTFVAVTPLSLPLLPVCLSLLTVKKKMLPKNNLLSVW